MSGSKWKDKIQKAFEDINSITDDNGKTLVDIVNNLKTIDINPLLPKGKRFCEDHYHSGKVSSSAGFSLLLKDNSLCKNDEDLKRLRSATHRGIMRLLHWFPSGVYVRVIYEKDKPIELIPWDSKQLIHQLTYHLNNNSLPHLPSGGREYFQFHGTVDFFPLKKDVELEVDLFMNDDTGGSRVDSLPLFHSDNYIKALYYALDEEVEKIFIDYDGSEVKVQSVPAFPELGIELYEEKIEFPILESSDIKGLLACIESGKKPLIKQALQLAWEDSKSKKKIINRFETLVQTRLNKIEIDQKDYMNGLLSTMEIRKALNSWKENNLHKNVISLSNFRNDESKFMVNLIGGMVRSAINLKDFTDEAKKADNEEALLDIFMKYSDQVKKHWQKASSLYKDGWFGPLKKMLLKIKLEKVSFHRTQFEDGMTSPVFSEFLYFLGMITQNRLEFNLYQSTAIEFSELIWLLPVLPTMDCTETEVSIASSPLTFKRGEILFN